MQRPHLLIITGLLLEWGVEAMIQKPLFLFGIIGAIAVIGSTTKNYYWVFTVALLGLLVDFLQADQSVSHSLSLIVASLIIIGVHRIATFHTTVIPILLQSIALTIIYPIIFWTLCSFEQRIQQNSIQVAPLGHYYQPLTMIVGIILALCVTIIGLILQNYKQHQGNV